MFHLQAVLLSAHTIDRDLCLRSIAVCAQQFGSVTPCRSAQQCAENACLQIRPTETNCTNRSQKQTAQIQTQIQNKTSYKTKQTQNQFNNKSIQYQLNQKKLSSKLPINQSITSQLKISLPTNHTIVMSRRESRFFEEMDCGMRRL